MMIEALLTYPDWEANYKNKLYYFNYQNRRTTDIRVWLGKKSLMKQVVNQPLASTSPYNIITEEIFDPNS